MLISRRIDPGGSGRNRRRHASWIVAVVVSAGFSLTAKGDVSAFRQAPDFAQFIAVQDIVVQGMVLSTRDRVPRLFGVPHNEVTIKIDEILLGSTDDSTLVMARLGPGSPRIGARVLFWGSREGEDAWKIYGNLCTVREDGCILAGYDEQNGARYLGPSETTFIDLPTLRTEIARHSSLHPSSAFERQAALALGRIVRTTRRGDQGFTYECDSLGWVMGHATRVPRFIDWSPVPSCLPELAPGDTLLIPVSGDTHANRVTLAACPSGLRAKRGFVPVLGVPLGSIDRAIWRDSDGLHVRHDVSVRN